MRLPTAEPLEIPVLTRPSHTQRGAARPLTLVLVVASTISHALNYHETKYFPSSPVSSPPIHLELYIAISQPPCLRTCSKAKCLGGFLLYSKKYILKEFQNSNVIITDGLHHLSSCHHHHEICSTAHLATCVKKSPLHHCFCALSRSSCTRRSLGKLGLGRPLLGRLYLP